MKKIFLGISLLLCAALCACAPREKVVIILSTNDIHAQIQNFPQLATAVAECRDTASVILVDAGDRWTGNAYVDQAEGRRPVLELMNELGYDVATLGNHEFDVGQQTLAEAIDYCRFPVICANMVSENSPIPQLKPYVILDREGEKFAFVAAVTNYGYNNHPDGHDAIFEGLRFTDAVRTLEEYEYLRDSCQVLVALTHIGSKYDRELADEASEYDLIIGGHSHERINEVEDGVLITQTGRNLNMVGVTEVRLRGKEILSLSFRLVPLADYAPDPVYQEMVEAYRNNPVLKEKAGELTATADKVGVANIFLQALKRKSGSDVAFYHYGGIRRDSLSKGDLTRSDIYDLDPFISSVSVMEMTPEQMSKMVLTKYNDTVNKGESHRIDLFSTAPYVIRTDGYDAVEVIFPGLVPGRKYRVAMGDYVFKNYRGLEYTNGETTQWLVPDVLMEYVANGGKPLAPDNTLRQSVAGLHDDRENHDDRDDD